MIYLKEPNTNRIVEFQSKASIGAGFANWTELTESEITAYELQEAKDAKIAQLKTNRDNNLSSPMASIQAFEYGTTQNVYFEFLTKSTGNSLTEPANIIFRALSYPSVKYSCNIIEGETKRKGYVEITKDVAESLSSHLQLRATANIQYANDLEEGINAITIDGEYFDENQEPITAIEALDNINIDF
jgi:hypothetical protein